MESSFEVALRMPYSVYPRTPFTSEIRNESGRHSNDEIQLKISILEFSPTLAIFTMEETKTKMVVENRFPPSLNCPNSLTGNLRRIVLYSWTMGPEQST